MLPPNSGDTGIYLRQCTRQSAVLEAYEEPKHTNSLDMMSRPLDVDQPDTQTRDAPTNHNNDARISNGRGIKAHSSRTPTLETHSLQPSLNYMDEPHFTVARWLENCVQGCLQSDCRYFMRRPGYPR